MNQAVFDTIAQTISTILTERKEPVPELKPQTLISASGLDSLDIATLTVRLDERIGRLPEEAFRQFPETLGEMADLYARCQQPQPDSEVLRT